ncbi:RICIN domain-containing protein [Luteolibacter marinus]|uniref:RICIN domain-containing protein n=1 Tax=Luteolibacter marinus TaxID=2776705 RepID=UPI00186915BE|nr:RICIN domain-containing protein [Luteolibacter marinus]
MFLPAPADEAGAVAALPERRLLGSAWDLDPDPDLAAFAGWTKRFLEAATEERMEMEAEGIELAEQRRGALALHIMRDPRRALAAALPLEIRDVLPEGMAGLLEERVDAIGDTGHVCALPRPGEPVIDHPDFAAINDRYYDAYRYGQSAGIDFIDDGSIHGIAIGDRIAILDSPLRQLEPGESPVGKVSDLSQLDPSHGDHPVETDTEHTVYQFGGDQYGSTCCESHIRALEGNLLTAASERRKTDDLTAGWDPGSEVHYLSADGGGAGESGYLNRPSVGHTHGTKKVLVFRANTPGHPLASSVTNDSSFSTALSAAVARYPLMSYNKMSLQSTYTPVYNLSSSFDATYDIQAITTECQSIAAANGYNLSDYDCFTTVVAPVGVGWAGLASGNRIHMNNSMGQDIFIHEFGHFLGLGHANSWGSSDGDSASPNHVHYEYGDRSCWMGIGYGNVAPTRTYSINSLNRLRWIPDARIQSVTASGTYTVYQNDGSIDPNSQVRGLKFSRDDEHTYWLGLISNNVVSPLDAFGNGLSVRLQRYDQSSTTLLDLNDPSGGIYNSPLTVGQTFYDPTADLSIKLVSLNGTNPNRSAQVQITFGPRYSGGIRPLTHGGIYRFANGYNTGICLGTTNASSNGLPVSMLTASDTDANQQWVAVWNGSDGTYSFNLRGTDKWLTVQNNGTGNGTNILQSTATSGDSQRFKVFPRNGGAEIILGKSTGSGDGTTSVVDMAQGNSDVLLWSYNGGVAQGWVAEMVGITTSQSYRILCDVADRQAIETDGGNPANGGVVRMWEWGGGTHQKWNAEANSSGTLRFTSASFPAKSLDLNVGAGSLTTWHSGAGSNQRWNIQRLGGSWFRMISDAEPTKSVDVTANGANGAGVVVWQHHSGSNQRLRFADSAN